MKNDILYYSVGALLYCPANKTDIADSIINEKFGQKFSLALCLEDTISDSFVTQAEQILTASLQKIYQNLEKKDFYLDGNGIIDAADSSDFPIGVAFPYLPVSSSRNFIRTMPKHISMKSFLQMNFPQENSI